MKVEDKELSIIRMLGMALAALYAVRCIQKKGTLRHALRDPDGANMRGHEFIDKAADTFGPLIQNPQLRDMVRTLGHGAIDKLTK